MRMLCAVLSAQDYFYDWRPAVDGPGEHLGSELSKMRLGASATRNLGIVSRKAVQKGPGLRDSVLQWVWWFQYFQYMFCKRCSLGYEAAAASNGGRAAAFPSRGPEQKHVICSSRCYCNCQGPYCGFECDAASRCGKPKFHLKDLLAYLDCSPPWPQSKLKSCTFYASWRPVSSLPPASPLSQYIMYFM